MSTESKKISTKSSISTPLFAVMKVLVVEDNTIIQKMLVLHLQNLGIACDLATDVVGNGQEVVKKLSAPATTKYDLIIMDIDMPIMNGYEATKQIRILPDWQNTPIIAFSADEGPTAKEKAIAAGMNYFLSKSATLERLTAVIAKYLPGTAV
jgi:two-component system sensor histidine kinase/response regulator